MRVDGDRAAAYQHIVHVLDLCLMFGWENTGRALTYYNPKAGDIAKRIMAGVR